MVGNDGKHSETSVIDSKGIRFPQSHLDEYECVDEFRAVVAAFGLILCENFISFHLMHDGTVQFGPTTGAQSPIHLARHSRQ